ncbi:MAG: hypothetical protein EAY65_07730 [Alphaproteobacteria bacterium]|nr:MAG: hypothetical protein EAY65_07730 [Alphaproteobacteria bacterium]
MSLAQPNPSRAVGEANPIFALLFGGFMSPDDASVINTLPTVTTLADATSIAGLYDLTMLNGNDDNYDFSFTNPVGTLTVTALSAPPPAPAPSPAPAPVVPVPPTPIAPPIVPDVPIVPPAPIVPPVPVAPPITPPAPSALIRLPNTVARVTQDATINIVRGPTMTHTTQQNFTILKNLKSDPHYNQWRDLLTIDEILAKRLRQE